MQKINILCLFMIVPSWLYAADEYDTRLRLEQDLLQQHREQQQALKQQQQMDQLPSLMIEGKMIHINNNLNDLGQALYLAVMQKQWQAASIYLPRYLGLAGYDVALAKFAQAALARAQGRLDHAEQSFKEALNLQPQNIPIQLELARLWTERQKNKEAKQLFNQIKVQLLARQDPLVPQIVKSIDIYLQGLYQRDAWQGLVSLGTRYSTNINSTSEKSTIWTIYAQDQDGQNIPVRQVIRKTPDAIHATALDYEVTLNKRWSLSDYHGIALKSLSYGRFYRHDPDYNEMTFSLNLGYSYQNQHHQILLAPIVEHRRYQNQHLSTAWGGRAEWMKVMGQDKAMKLELVIKDIDHQIYRNQSGIETATFATFWKVLPQHWTLFGGIDWIDHNSQEQYFTAYQQQGLRLGLSKQCTSGLNMTLFSSFRWRQYDKFNPVLAQKRDDFEQNYTLLIRVPQWKFYQITPNFTYQYTRNKSSVNWLYTYDKHILSLKLERRF